MIRAVVVAVLFGSPALAGPPTVAVMPFRDLSGSKGAIGEALRETVTTDLRDVPGLRVIERGSIDKVIAEQNLAAQRSDLTTIASVRVGTLLGATMIVTGAYQRADASVRLTARFVKVETGEIVGSAKVDGASADFLKLQDKVTVALLRSAGLEKHAPRFTERSRPRLANLRSVELYGEAVVEPDDGKRRVLLAQAVQAEPSFGYAARDLDALEKRLKSYDAAAKREVRDEAARLEQAIAAEHDGAKLLEEYDALYEQLASQRRYRRMRAVGRECGAHPPKDPPRKLAETCLRAVIEADQHLWDDESLLTDGEAFVRRFPTSRDYKGVREALDEAIAKHRRCAERKEKIYGEILKAGRDVCKMGEAYDNACENREARDCYLRCIKGHERDAASAVPLMRLIWMNIRLNDWVAAARALADLQATKTHWGDGMVPALENQEAYPFPVDE